MTKREEITIGMNELIPEVIEFMLNPQGSLVFELLDGQRFRLIEDSKVIMFNDHDKKP